MKVTLTVTISSQSSEEGVTVLVTLDQNVQPPNSRTLEVLIASLYCRQSFTFGTKPVSLSPRSGASECEGHMYGEDLNQIMVSRRFVNGV